MNANRLCIALALLALACRDQAPPASSQDLASTVPRGSTQVFVQQAPITQADRVTFVVRVVANGVSVGAYQGAVTFVPGAFELVGIETPKGASGDLYLVNPAGFAGGRIRFAAYTTEKFTDTEAFRVTVKPLKPLGEARLTGTLDVAGEVSGVRMSRSRIMASRGILDARSNAVIVP